MWVLMAAHTPGPWTSDYPERFIVRAGNLQICELPHAVSSWRQANTRLIAASPELLQAAKTLLDVMRDRDGRGYDPATKARDETRLRDAVLGMAAAVDKAEGNQ